MLRVYPLPHAFPPTVLGCEAHPCDKRGRSPSAVANQRASLIRRFIRSTTGSIRSKLGYASGCANLSRLWLRASSMRSWCAGDTVAHLAAT